MPRLRTRRRLPVEAELEEHLLMRPQTVEQRDRRVECLEVEVAGGVFQPLEEARQRLAVDARLAGAAHTRSCDAGCAEIEQEDAPEPVTGVQAHMATPQSAYPHSPNSGKELAKLPLSLFGLNFRKSFITDGAPIRS